MDLPDTLMDARYEQFQRVDTSAVPIAIEWINGYSRRVVARLGEDAEQALSGLPRVSVSNVAGYLCVTLGSEPFSYSDRSAVELQAQAHGVLRLEVAHAMHPRVPVARV